MTVKPDVFVDTMTNRWQEALNNVPSPALRAVWRQMAETFNSMISTAGAPEGRFWKVLSPPTGSGKTQGLILYCSMLAEPGGSAPPVGGLIVTRLISEADSIARSINGLVGQTVALACHSESRPTPEAIDQAQFLVVTHSAYESALDRLKHKQGDHAWERFANWQSGQRRKLVVIDEALDVVRISQSNLYELQKVLGMIPVEVKDQFPDQIRAIEFVQDLLEGLRQLPEGQDQIVQRTPLKDAPSRFDMTELRKACRGLPWDRLVDNQEHAQRRMQKAQAIDRALLSVQSTMANWNWYHRKGDLHLLNTAAYIIPDDVDGAVVMDATARDNLLYDLFEHRVERLLVPPGARSYAKVTLHVYRATVGVGKTGIRKHGKRYLEKALPSIQSVLGKYGGRADQRKLFVCCHKFFEPELAGIEHPFAELETAHWNAVDGRNDWQDYDTAVIWGLPYRDRTWSVNTYMAIQGLQSDQWLNEPNKRRFGRFGDIRTALERHQLIVSVVQAINRVRCRKVINIAGECERTDVFMMLPSGVNGDYILDGIKRQMPGLQVIDWELGLEPARRIRRSDTEKALVSFAGEMASGQISAGTVQHRLGISRASWTRLAAKLRDNTSNLHNELSKIGVRYVVSGVGQRCRAHLQKGVA